MTLYLYLNAALYALFAVWCTVAATKTSHTIGYLALSSGGRSEYLVIYGGLQFGLAAIFYLCARDSAFLKLGIAIALALYVPIVLYRAVTIARFWPVAGATLATGALETVLLVWAIWLCRGAA